MDEHSSESRSSTGYIIRWVPLVQDEQAILDNIAFINWKGTHLDHSNIKEDGSWVTPPSFAIIQGAHTKE